MIGPVGSGKSYVARMLTRKLGARVIQTDDIRVALRRKGQPESRAIPIAHRLQERFLSQGRSLVLDHDVVNPARRRELQERLSPFGAKVWFIKIEAPEGLILARLREKRYTADDLFPDADEAIRVYHIRKKFRAKFEPADRPPAGRAGSGRRFKPDLTVDNSKPLEPQIDRIARQILGSPPEARR